MLIVLYNLSLTVFVLLADAYIEKFPKWDNDSRKTTNFLNSFNYFNFFVNNIYFLIKLKNDIIIAIFGLIKKSRRWTNNVKVILIILFFRSMLCLYNQIIDVEFVSLSFVFLHQNFIALQFVFLITFEFLVIFALLQYWV